MGRPVQLCIVFDSNERLWLKLDELAGLLGYRAPRAAVLLHVHHSCTCTWSELSEGKNYPPSTLFISEVGIHNLLCKTRFDKASILQRWFVEEIVPVARRGIVTSDSFGYIYVAYTPQSTGTFQIFTTDNIEQELNAMKTTNKCEWRVLLKLECKNRARMLQDIYLLMGRYRVTKTFFCFASIEHANYICAAAYSELLNQRALHDPNDGIYINK